MKQIPIHPLETARLRLRLIRDSDLFHYHRRLTSDPLVAQHMLWHSTEDMAHTAASIRRILDGYAAGTRWHWGIALKEEDSLIGTVALLGFDLQEESCRFAYMLGREFWGKGYGTEALNAVFRFAFDEMEVRKIQADHFTENPASGAAMKKAGMARISVTSGKYEKDGVLHDAVDYAITREQWQTRR